jgi:hypothetical protein
MTQPVIAIEQLGTSPPDSSLLLEHNAAGSTNSSEPPVVCSSESARLAAYERDRTINFSSSC